MGKREEESERRRENRETERQRGREREEERDREGERRGDRERKRQSSELQKYYYPDQCLPARKGNPSRRSQGGFV